MHHAAPGQVHIQRLPLSRAFHEDVQLKQVSASSPRVSIRNHHDQTAPYIIGNGFDLHHHLPTQYWRFKEYLKKMDREVYDWVESYSCGSSLAPRRAG
ncbi:AbiH family protein [Pseudomonas hunanensis]|uniref:AbiH family protein n=1 Tax=Pseudomonas hunanensis TaxID=1247546 RepID=UPI0030DD6040